MLKGSSPGKLELRLKRGWNVDGAHQCRSPAETGVAGPRNTGLMPVGKRTYRGHAASSGQCLRTPALDNTMWVALLSHEL